jgi:signal transduction histidine kinase
LESEKKIFSRPNARRARRIFAVVLLGIAIIISFLTVWSYKNELKSEETAYLLRLEGIARSLALQSGVAEGHEILLEKYKDKDDISRLGQDSTYDFLHRWLRQNWESNMLKSDIYTMVFDSIQSKFCFVATSGLSPYYRHQYAFFHKCLLDKYNEGSILNMYGDEFGMWLSAFAPIKNKFGKTVAILMADEKFDVFIQNARTKALKNVFLALIIALPFAVLLAIWVRRMLLREDRLSQELEKSYEKLASLDKLRKEMIANISHDLRTPLSSLSGYLETVILKKDSLNEADRDRFLGISLKESVRLRDLIDDLFELSKLEANQVKLNTQPFPMAELAQDVLYKYELIGREKNIKVEALLLETAWVEADLKLINRVLQNFFDNAIRYNQDGGKIVFKLEKDHLDPQKMKIEVKNTGIGIEKEDLPHIFDRYFKKSDSQKHTGSTGLGLAIVKKMLDLHQEPIEVTSENGWTTFGFKLPIWQKNATPPV